MEIERTSATKDSLEPHTESNSPTQLERRGTVERVEQLWATLDQFVDSHFDVDRIVIELTAPTTHEALSVLPRIDRAAQRTQLQIPGRKLAGKCVGSRGEGLSVHGASCRFSVSGQRNLTGSLT